MACPIALPQNMSLKRAMYILQDGRCPYCGREMVFSEPCKRRMPKDRHKRLATFEHIHPRSKHGDNSFENRMLACFECNCRRSDGPTHVGMYVTKEG